MPIETPGSRSQVLDAALWTASFVLFVLSIVLSWGAPPDIGPDFDWVDKAWHFLGYAALTGTLLLAAVWRPGRGGGRFPRAGRPTAILVLAVAWATEALQAPFGRDVQLADAAADLAGVATGFLGWNAILTVDRGGGPAVSSRHVEVAGGEQRWRGRLHLALLRVAGWMVARLLRNRGMRRATILLGRIFGGRDWGVSSVPGGGRIRVSLSDPYWIPPLLLRGAYEPEVAALLSAVMSRESSFIDCGANIGWWSVYAASIIPAPERILAVEPASNLYAQLLENAKLNYEAFKCIQAAVWDMTGTPLTLQVEKHHAGRSSVESSSALWSHGYDHTEIVQSITLDDLIDRCRGNRSATVAVKLDVEGAELRALDGARRHMGSIDVIVYEDHGKDDGSTVTGAMREKGLDIFYCDDSLRMHRVVDPDAVRAIKQDPRRGYNFAACPPSSPAWIRLSELASSGP